MRDLSKDARVKNRGHGLAVAAMAAALAMAFASLAHATLPEAASPTADPMITGSITAAPAVADHELRIEFTREGAEGLALSARLAEMGGIVTQPVLWAVRRAVGGSAAAGELVFSGEIPGAELKLRPGDYRIEAAYGPAHIVHEVAIQPGQWVGVTLILQVGGVRALSLVADQNVPMSITAAHRIYALSGRRSGQRMTATGQGELARLQAGDYRVESRFEPGNAVAEATVAVRPGVLSSLEIAHLAGLVRVELRGAANDESFEVRDLGSNWAWRGRGSGGDLVLAPGRYEARALNRDIEAVDFEVARGDSIVILLDP